MKYWRRKDDEAKAENEDNGGNNGWWWTGRRWRGGVGGGSTVDVDVDGGVRNWELGTGNWEWELGVGGLELGWNSQTTKQPSVSFGQAKMTETTTVKVIPRYFGTT
ncbi:hypothetical protein TWF217_000740 [Orbilia oligospora]|nr:hypothetical protein TWF751_011958 [Orbilia oligospora]KAF3236871.1 hypothetical protein TWF128_001266 [Orbilia oligospora]KAF3240673.1 hypothetical protein TWF217_000740 [Orbilia oligospora]